jgi:hypothetical protein
MMRVKLRELEEALLVASGGPEAGDTGAFISKATGEIYCRFDPMISGDDVNDDLPEDLEDGEKYIQVPDKRELDLGQALVLDFAMAAMPDDLDEVRDIFRRRGAYGRFKSLLARRGKIDEWHDFENRATLQALREWCVENGLEVEE